MGTYSKKEQLVFQAVLKLIRQGVDLHTVKVQDIATAAGIGKGTLYEYFSSKEEIIMQTLSYLFLHEIEFFEDIMREQQHFDRVIELMLHHVAEQESLPTAKICHSVFSISAGSESIQRQLDELYRSRFLKAVSKLIACGRRDGIIADTCTDSYCLFVIRAASFNLASAQLCRNSPAQTYEHFIKLFHNAFRA